MGNKKKIYIILFVTVVLLCLGGFLWSYTVTKDIGKPGNKQNSKEQFVTVKNLVLTETKDGLIYWELYAAKGNYDSKSGRVILTDATGNFYNSDKKVVLSFESDTGTYFEAEKTIILKGNTNVVAHDGSSITADEIIFKGKGEDITASGNVVVKRGDDFISTAQKAKFNSDLTIFEISGKTQTNVYTKSDIKAQELTN